MCMTIADEAGCGKHVSSIRKATFVEHIPVLEDRAGRT